MGDFNTILNASEKKGGAPFNPNSPAKFCDTLDQYGLLDIGSCGPRFMWIGAVFQNYVRVFKHLNRAVSNVE